MVSGKAVSDLLCRHAFDSPNWRSLRVKVVAGDFLNHGFAVIETDTSLEQMQMLIQIFLSRFLPRFESDPIRNRNIIKLFAEELNVKRFFCGLDIDGILRDNLGMVEPVQTGPIVTHYTANDLTGGNYGLPYHQDWPSMGTSTKGVIAWVSITDSKQDSAGVTVVPGSQLFGLWPGEQTDMGYVVHKQAFDKALDVEVRLGQILLMSPWLVHKTRYAKSGSGWKLSLSCRFDDVNCPEWNRRNYISAYRTSVDRRAYKN